MDNAISNFRVFASRAKHATQNHLCPADKKFSPTHLEDLHTEADTVQTGLQLSTKTDEARQYHEVLQATELARLTGSVGDLAIAEKAVESLRKTPGIPKDTVGNSRLAAAKISAQRFYGHAHTQVSRERNLSQLADKVLQTGKLIEAKRNYDVSQLSRPVLGTATEKLAKLKTEIGTRHFIARDMMGDRARIGTGVPSDHAVALRLQTISQKLHNAKRIGELRNGVKAHANGIIKYGTGDATAMLEHRAQLETKLGENGAPMIKSLDRKFVAPALLRKYDSTAAAISVTKALHGDQSFGPLTGRVRAMPHTVENANDLPDATSFHAATQNLEQLRRALPLVPAHIATALPPIGGLESQYQSLLLSRRNRRGGSSLQESSISGDDMHSAASDSPPTSEDLARRAEKGKQRAES